MALPPLRDYQTKLTDEWLACIARGVPGTLVVASTGAGKTRITVEVISILIRMGWKLCYFMHKDSILDQSQEVLDAYGLPYGIIAPKHGLTSHPLHIASIDTVTSRFAELAAYLDSLNHGFAGEAHHIQARTWGRTFNAIRQISGDTATPWRKDGKPLGDFFTEALRAPSFRELQRLGYLCQIKTYAPPTHYDLSRVERAGGDYTDASLSKVMNTPEIRLDAIRAYAKLCPGEPGIAFCCDRQHAYDLADDFAAAHWRAEYIDGTDSPAERRRKLKALRSGQLDMLTSCGLIGEGTDIPVASCGIDVRPRDSTMLYDQNAGRVARPAEWKDWATWIDLARNAQKHGLPGSHREWTLERGLTGTPPQNRRCPHCWFLADVGPMHCPDCGAAYLIRAGLPNAAGPARLSSLPGLGGYSATDIKNMEFNAVLKLIKSKYDAEIIASCRGYDSDWVKTIGERLAKTRAGQKGMRA